MSKKLLYENVKYFIEIESNSGCKLLSDEYIDCESKLKIQDANGHKYLTSFKDFKTFKKYQCNKCSFKNSSIKQAKTHEKFV